MIRCSLTRLPTILAMLPVLGFFLFGGCSRDYPSVTPAPESNFVKSIVVERVLTGDTILPLADITEIRVNQGFVVQFEITPAEQYPDELGSREVLHPDEWPADLVIFPRGTTVDDANALRGCCPIFTRSSGPSKSGGDHMINSYYSGFWKTCGFDSKDVLKHPVSEESRTRLKQKMAPWFWTYLCAGENHVGEFVYEIRIYPTAAWKSLIRWELGEPVVLKRGLLRVVPAE